VLIFF